MILPLFLLIGYSAPVFSWLSAIPNTGSLPASVRAPCRAALAENITTCSEWLTYPDEWIPVESLEEICTSGCQNSLVSMQVKAASACGTGSVNITTNVTSAILTPLNLATALVYRYNATCLRDTFQIPHSVLPSNFANIAEILHTSGFCKEKLQNFTDATFCSDCYMKKTQLEIDGPLTFGGGYSPAEFNELKISCGIPTSSYPVKMTSPAATPRPTLECASKVTAKAGQTTNQIAKSNSVSTDRLLTWNNNLPSSINDTLTRDEVICLDNVQICLLHQISQGDTCGSLTKLSGKGVTDMMFQSWNPTIGSGCRNLHGMIGKYICISPSGQDTPFTPIEGTPKPTVTTTKAPESTYSWGQAPNSPTSSVKNFTTTWLFPTDPVSLSTRTASMWSPAEATAIAARSSHCPFLEEGDDDWQEGLTNEEYHLHSWDLAEDCAARWDPYCNPKPTDPVLPSPTAIPSSCYPTISTIVPEGGVNPPGPTNSGSPEYCNKWHFVVSGDNCGTVEAKYKISHATFRQWNPSINEACTNLKLSMAYCVRVWVEMPESNPAPTASTSVSSSVSLSVSRTSTSAGPPGPTQSGTSATCTKWHLDKQGDTCDSIATQYGIIVSRFRQLNRGVNSGCSNLVVGNAYCVG